MSWTTRLRRRREASKKRSVKEESRHGTYAHDPLADEHDEGDEISRENDRVAGEQERQSESEKEVPTPTPKGREVQQLLAAATHRDHLANRRDSAANDRDIRAGLAALLTDTQKDEAAFEARGFARQDRRSSRLDRVASSDDRLQLSTSDGELSLPASVPVQRGVLKPLTQCTPMEVTEFSSQLLHRALDETRDAIDLVEQEGAASPHVEEVLAQSRSHRDDADDLLWYVNEWLRTGNRPQPRSEG